MLAFRTIAKHTHRTIGARAMHRTFVVLRQFCARDFCSRQRFASPRVPTITRAPATIAMRGVDSCARATKE
jgi:hypothetical protein